MIGLMFGIFALLVIIGTPIAFAIGLSTFLALSSQDTIPLLVVAQRFFTTLDSFSLVAIPLFMLAGELMTHTGLTERIIRFAVTLVGHIRGGFAQVTVATSVMFSGVSGSAAADASATGSLLIPAMKKEKYDPGFAASLVATASIIGPIIPPSIMMIIYGSMTGVSIGDLFLAGIVPGILLGLGLMVYCYFYARRNNIVSTTRRSSWKEVWDAFKGAVWALILPVIIVVGIRFGVFTPTEAAAVAVAYAFVYGFAYRTLHVKHLPKIFLNAAVLSTISLMIMAAAAAFSWILAFERIPQKVVDVMTSLTSEPVLIMLLLIAILLFVGLFIEASAALIILIPVLIGIQKSFGFDPVHFALIVILTLVIGGVTPPVGNLLYITMSIAKVKMSQAFWKVWPLAGVMILMTLIFTFFPEIVTFLPKLTK